MLFGIPLDQKIEIIHSRDAALALVNAINNEKAYNKVFFGGGGVKCQLYQRDFIFEMIKPMGISKLPENLFKKPESDTNTDGWFYRHWMDTKNSQEVLQFQRKTLEDYKKDVRGPPFIQKIILKILSPFIRRSLMIMSPYKH